MSHLTYTVNSIFYAIRLIIEPVYDKFNSWVGRNVFLIQLKVNKGEPHSLYEDGEHEVFKIKFCFAIVRVIFCIKGVCKKQ